MHDTGKVLLGLGVFAVLATAPLWYGVGRGTGAPPELKKPVTEKQCVEPVAFMRASHMELLNAWRDAVVRNGERVYVAADGRRWDISLTGTCLRCHDEQDKFCDRCHAYAAVEPVCWDCHQKKTKPALAALPRPDLGGEGWRVGGAP